MTRHDHRADPGAIPTGLLTLQQRSDVTERHGLDPFADFEAVTVPFAALPSHEQTRVTKWAALRGGPVPQTVTAYRVRASKLQTRLAL